MHLKALDLNGFKSFALPTHLEFSPGMTAIVGPNGSGKSNIADAVRWVLGETSLKTLRGKKSGDVIFAGSHGRAGQSMAEITLIFDNSDSSLPVDAAEVSITRRLFRNGDSDYEINGAPVRKMDINELLIKAGLGERSYAVIGQGQVADILRASPAERKEFFEEAAGVKQFQQKKEQSLRKLEITRRNLLRVNDLIKEVKPRLNSLKRQAERAALREEIEKEYKSASLTWFGSELAALDEAAQTDQQTLTNLTKQRTDLEEAISQLEKKQMTLEQDNIGQQRQQLNQEREQLRQNLNELEKKRAALRYRLTSLQQKGLAIDVSSLPARITALEDELLQKTGRIEQLAAPIKILLQKNKQALKLDLEATKQIQDLRQQLNSQKPATSSLDRKEINQLVKKAQQSLLALVKQLKELSSLDELPRLVGQAEEPRRQLEILSAKLKRQEPIDLNKLSSNLNQLQEKRDQLLANLAGYREELATKQTEHTLLSKQVGALQNELHALKEQLAGAKKSGKSGAQKAAQETTKKELTTLEANITQNNQQLQKLDQQLASLNQQDQEFRNIIKETTTLVRQKRDQLTPLLEKENMLNVKKGKFDVRHEDLLAEAQQVLGQQKTQALSRGGADILPLAKRQSLKNKIAALRKKLEQAGSVDEAVTQEYQEISQRHDFLNNQSHDLSEASEKLRDIIKELDKKIRDLFSKSLHQINVEFDRAFKVLFNGGSAKLILARANQKKAAATTEEEVSSVAVENAEDEISQELEKLRQANAITGVDIKANPPGKKLQTVSMLSGGEKALTSIALLSAILATKHAPFVVLDEVDAALDEANSRRFAKIIKSLADKTQFIAITHNRETMRQASILYGVTMQKDGVSKLLSVKMDVIAEDGSMVMSKA